MSERALKRILTLVGAVVAAWIAVIVVDALRDSGDDPGAVADALASLDPELVREVDVIRGGDTIRLRSGDGGWTVNGYAADSARVARLSRELADTRVTGPVARNPENHARLGVAADSADRLTLRTEAGEERTLLVGRSGPTRPSAYVRLPGRNPVHVVHADLGGAVARSLEGWRDRTVVRVDTARVHTLVLFRDDAATTLDRGDAGWTLDDGSPADQEAVRGILGALSNLRATAFAPDSATVDGADRRLAALDPEGDTLTVLSLAAMELPGTRVEARGSPTIYELTTYQMERLFPEPAALRGDPGDGT